MKYQIQTQEEKLKEYEKKIEALNPNEEKEKERVLQVAYKQNQLRNRESINGKKKHIILIHLVLNGMILLYKDSLIDGMWMRIQNKQQSNGYQ